MSLPERIGVESFLEGYLPLPGQPGSVRARFRIDNSEAAPAQRFGDGDWLKVSVVARVYDREQVERSGAVPEVPLAEGTEIAATARTSWTVVDLPLPPVPIGHHGVVAKVFSADDRYRKLFDPSKCHLGIVSYGFVTRMKLSDLQSVYAPGGVGNPLAEAEIKRQVRAGGVIAQADNGALLRATEVNGSLVISPIQG